MGWFWDVKPHSTQSENPPLQLEIDPPPQSSSTTSHHDASEPSLPPMSSTRATSTPQTREDQAHEELMRFLYSVEESYKKPRAPTKDTILDSKFQTLDQGENLNPSAPERITPAHLYPARASCTILFDTAFHCASPYGHFLNVYRYGTFRQCGALWNEYMWCLRTNRGWMSQEEREERTLRKGWEKERGRLIERGGTSEEIWEPRKLVLKDAFSEGQNVVLLGKDGDPSKTKP